MLRLSLFFCSLLTVVATLTGCATESHRKVDIEPVSSHQISYQGPKALLVVGQFNNRSNYMQGLFSTDNDQLGSQAKTILKTHLQQTNRFTVLDRDNLVGNAQEAQLAGVQQQLKGARYTVTGAVTEFGRKNVGDKQLFGLLGSGKSQIAYAKVSLNIVDVISSEVVYSVQGAGEYELNSREVIGFGSTASYDATLNGKVLDFAIKESINELVKALQSGALVLSAN